MDLKEAAQAGPSRHPWETARYRFFADELDRAGLLGRPMKVLDVGAGDAWLAESLARDRLAGSEISCFDVNYPFATATEAVGSNRITRTSVRPEGRFDLVLLLDVLEHVEDDAAFLDGIVDHQLAPGGHVLISVPAWPAVWTPHDRFLHHFRRYTPTAARKLVRNAGLRELRHGGLFHSLLPVRGLQALAARVRPPAEDVKPELSWGAGRAVTTGVELALRADNWLSHRLADLRWGLPGLSWWALCTR